MHITNLYVAVSMATFGHSLSFEGALYDLHAIHGGYPSWSVYEKADPTATKGDIEILPHDHAHFEISLKCVGLIDNRVRYHLTYSAPEQGNADRADLVRITIYATRLGIITDVEI